jgi:hypothetical protein
LTPAQLEASAKAPCTKTTVGVRSLGPKLAFLVMRELCASRATVNTETRTHCLAWKAIFTGEVTR